MINERENANESIDLIVKYKLFNIDFEKKKKSEKRNSLFDFFFSFRQHLISIH